MKTQRANMYTFASKAVTLAACIGALIVLSNTDASKSPQGENTSPTPHLPAEGYGSFSSHCVGVGGPGDVGTVVLANSLVISQNVGTPDFSSRDINDTPFCGPIGFASELGN